MATKTSKLHTTFTGDDKHFQRAAGRVMKSGTQMGAMAGKLKGAFAAMGGAMLVSGIVEKFDRIGKLAKRFDMTAETLQKLGHVAKLGGSDIETVGKAMKTLNTSTAEARKGLLTYTREFEVLGLNVDDFWNMNHRERWMKLADAVKNTTDRNAALAAVTKLMGRSGADVFTILEEGAAVTQEMMKGIATASNETVAALEGVNDKLTEISNTASTTFANFFVGFYEGLEKEHAKIQVGLLMLKNLFTKEFTPEQLANIYRETVLGENQVMPGRPLTEKQKQAEQRREIRDKWLGGWDKKEKEKKAQEDVDFINLITGDWGQSLTRRTFGDAGENPFAETIKEWEEKNRNPAWLRIKTPAEERQKQQRMLSGQFSEFVQTAGIGAHYAGKSPEQVQMEKQTDIMERQLEGIRKFNNSIEILTDNTTDR